METSSDAATLYLYAIEHIEYASSLELLIHWSEHDLPHLGISHQSPRWTSGQIYVSDADGDLANANSIKKNKKNGATVSVLKRGGWKESFTLAKLIGNWPA